MAPAALQACRFQIRGIVQDVGFRPYVFRLAATHDLAGWVLNASEGVEIHVEGPAAAVNAFERSLRSGAPSGAHIDAIAVAVAEPTGASGFEIRASTRDRSPTAPMSPDLPVCDDCLRELLDPDDRRFRYPYINCTHCGPRYSLIEGLPYDRARTTMAPWEMCPDCSREFHDPHDRRFHAQPAACPRCGPGYRLHAGLTEVLESDGEAIARTARLLREGRIVAIKSLGGYHLACDAGNGAAVAGLRGRKYRMEKPFAVMAKDLPTARAVVALSADAEALLLSPARPIVLAPARGSFDGVAPGHPTLGVMLPYTPLQHLLFEAGAPDVLVMTSGNRSGEPIAIEDRDAFDRLGRVADAFLVGERPIARRVDDSVARVTPYGPMILRRARGHAPMAAARFPSAPPILAVGADLKSTVTLVVSGDAFVSQHLGDLGDYAAAEAFRETIRDFLAMYDVESHDVILAHDRHPEYASTAHALALTARSRHAVQHHHAHVASVLAERGALEQRVLGVAFDGTGYGDDGAIWGGEFLAGSVMEGFARVAHLRGASLPGGDAAAAFPPQAAAGYVAQLGDGPDLGAPPFDLPLRYRQARRLVERGVRTFETTSVGRLFDAAAALLGFTREVTYEAQAAIWLEHLAMGSKAGEALRFEFRDGELDFRPALRQLIELRAAGGDPADLARAFHLGLARGVSDALRALREEHGLDTVALSGGVFQNDLLLHFLKQELEPSGLRVWMNRRVPPNDGGISLGQAALAVGSERARAPA